MATSIFVNLPIADLERSKAFYTGLGFRIEPNFTDENAACIVVDENVYFMVLTREFFATFTAKRVADPASSAQVLVALTRDSRAAVDAAIEAGLGLGGTEPPDTAKDYGFMYTRDLEDPDGNVLEFFWMEPRAAEIGPEAWFAEQGIDPTAQPAD